MSALLEIAERLQDTQAAIGRLEKAVAHNPDSPSALLSLNSLRKRQQDLEAQFARVTVTEELDVCSYRLFTSREGERPKLAALTDALSDFQALFSQVYSAVKNGPRERERVSADVLAETSFGFGYTFAGSVGFVLTLPNERLLLGETELDISMRLITEMAQAKTTDEIAAFKKDLGLAPIRTMYRWAEDHAARGLGAQIEWRRAGEVTASLFVQQPELEVLTRTIAQISEKVENEFEIEGQLVGLNSKYKTFHMEVEGVPDIKGRALIDIDAEHQIIFPAFYRARIRTETIVHYSTEKEDVSYFLLSLQE
jgi:hypothetical protein